MDFIRFDEDEAYAYASLDDAYGFMDFGDDEIWSDFNVIISWNP